MSSKIPVGRKTIAQPAVSALKRNNAHSSIPILRRSNSQSSIQPRQSRSSVRGPSQGRSRTKSLAVKSPMTCRARSTSNVKYATPQGDKREISPYSVQSKVSSCSSGTKDLRPVNDKEWQRSQLTRVKSFLNELDPCLPSIKPLSVSVFIAAMNLLLKEFDNRITITTENYKDEVIKYLKIFSYPGMLKLSLIKNISAPHEFPKVLAIFSWLIDRIEFIKNSDEILRPARATPENIHLYHMLLSYNIQKFKLWNQSNEAGADECLRDELCAYYDIQSLNIEENQKELEMLNAKAASLEEIKLNLQSKKEEMERLQEENEKAKDLNQEYIKQKGIFLQTSSAKKEETLKRIACVKKLIQMEEENKKEIKNILDTQKYDCVEKDNIIKRIQELSHTVKLNQDRKDAHEKSIFNYDEIILTTKLKLEEKIHKYNNDISKLIPLNRNLNELKLRETDLMEPTFLNALNKAIEKKDEWMEKFKVELKEKHNDYVKISAKIKEEASDIDDITKELDKKNLKIEELKEELGKLNCSRKGEINKEQLHLDELNKNFAVQKTDAEKKIEEYKQKVQDAKTQLTKHKKSMKRHCEFSEEFFEHIVKSIFQTISTRNEQRQTITNVFVKESSRSIISEATAAFLGINSPSEDELSKEKK